MDKKEPSEPNLKHRVIAKYEQMKGHVERNKPIYAFGAGAVVTIAVVIVTRRIITQHLNMTAMIARKIVIKDSVLLIETYARDQGPPSYMVLCVETGEKFISQIETARRMGLSASHLSSHLNGAGGAVKGYHFERLGMAIPKNG